MSELKPCPFCGGEAEIVIFDDEGNLRDREYEKDPWSGIGYAPFHPDKGCPIGQREPDEARWIYDTETEAIEAWNRRANDGD